MREKRRLLLALAILFALNILVICLAQAAQAATYQRGSTGGTVRQIQTKLKNWGYYGGSVDGVYGSATERAVRAFQQKNGLTVDGKAGPQTLKALGISAGTAAGSGSGDTALLARLISAEARGEPYNGQVAVGAVVLMIPINTISDMIRTTDNVSSAAIASAIVAEHSGLREKEGAET